MAYIKPAEVISPKARWKLIDVLLDKGSGQGAYAIGEWDGERRIAYRWNGTEDNEIGNPQSRGLPTWTILDSDLHMAIIQRLPEDKQALACALLKITIPPTIEIKIQYHEGSGRYTLMRRPNGQHMFEDGRGDLLGNTCPRKFLKAFYDEMKDHLDAGTRILLDNYPNPQE